MPAELIPEVQSELLDTQKFRQQMGHTSRHSSVFFAGTIFTAVAGYLFKVYLARVLGAEALGIYALGMAIIGFLGLFNALDFSSQPYAFWPSIALPARWDCCEDSWGAGFFCY